MKQFLKKFRLRRPDEMERHILFRAQRNAYLFLVAALAVWSFYESWQVYARHTRLNLLPCLPAAGGGGADPEFFQAGPGAQGGAGR